MFQSLSAEIDRVKKENDNMQIELRSVFLFHRFASNFHLHGPLISSLLVCMFML